MSTEIHCSYHLGHSAQWQCRACNSLRCAKCVPAARSPLWGTRGAVCHECNSILEYVGTSRQEIPPFWTQIGHFFKYPFTASTISLVIALTILAVIAETIGLLGVIVWLANYTLLLRYHYAIIEHRAHGEPDAPDLSSIFERDEHSLTLQTVGASILAVGGVALISIKVSPWLGLGLGVFFLIAYPAMMIVLAMEKRMLAALNPLTLVAFISKIGFPYLVLLICYSLVVGGEVYLVPVLSTVLGATAAQALTLVGSYYLFFVGSVMLGYVVYEYQSELGHVAHRHDDEDLDEDGFDKQRAQAETYMYICDRKLAQAKDRFRPLLDRFPDDMAMYDYYFRLLNVCDDMEAQIGLTNYIAESFLKENRISRAVSYVDQTKKRYPAYQPEKPELAYELASYLEQTGRYSDAAGYLRHFHKRFPKSLLIGRAYLLLARLSYERLNKLVEAKALLTFVKHKFAEREEAQEAVAYQKTIEQHSSAV